MELNELTKLYYECTDTKRARVLLTMLINKATELKDGTDEELQSEEPNSVTYEDLGMKYDLIEMQKATLKADEIKEKLSDEECRKGLKITEKLLKDLNRNDLLKNGYKTFNIVKQIRVSILK